MHFDERRCMNFKTAGLLIIHLMTDENTKKSLLFHFTNVAQVAKKSSIVKNL